MAPPDPHSADVRASATGAEPGPAARPALADDALAAEIELYADVVVAATQSDGPLAEGELDRVLGVAEGSPRR